MRHQTAKLILTAGSILLAAALTLGFLWQARFFQNQRDQMRLQADGLQKALNEEINLAIRQALSGSTALANDPAVVAAFAARDRQKLIAATGSLFDQMKGAGIAQIQFHTPPATSFLRLHNPDQFGDNLSALRATVVEANRTQKPVYGLEEGVAGWGIRAVVPVFSAGRHIGSVEFGSEFDTDFLKRIQNRRGGDYFLFRLPSEEEDDPTVLRFAATRADSPAPPAALVRQMPTVKTAPFERQGDRLVTLVPVADFRGRVRAYLMADEPLQADRWPTKTLVVIALTAMAAGLLALTSWMLTRLAARNG